MESPSSGTEALLGGDLPGVVRVEHAKQHGGDDRADDRGDDVEPQRVQSLPRADGPCNLGRMQQ